jgi:3-methyladenine DNA glycosylase AlkD
MTEKSLPKDEPGTQERFDRAIKNALAMAPKPHKPARPSADVPPARKA